MMFRFVAAAVSATALLTIAPGRGGPDAPSLVFTNIARAAGLDMQTVFGARDTNTYLVETTGTGVAMIDYDGDGWTDLFFVNGSTFEPPAGEPPVNHLYRNKGNRTFEDVTEAAGLAAGGWGQGACVGDYDNDGRDDLFVTGWGSVHLYRNEPAAGSATSPIPPGCASDRARGARAAPSSTTIATAASIFSWRATSISIPPPRRGRRQACAAIAGCRSPVGRQGFPAAATRSIATAATARSRT